MLMKYAINMEYFTMFLRMRDDRPCPQCDKWCYICLIAMYPKRQGNQLLLFNLKNYDNGDHKRDRTKDGKHPKNVNARS